MAALGLVLLLVFAPPLGAQRDVLTWPDYALLGLSTAAIVMDWGYTQGGVAQGLREVGNPLISGRPSAARINWVNLGQVAVNMAIARLNNATLRRVLWAVTGGVNAGASWRHWRLGVRWKMDLGAW